MELMVHREFGGRYQLVGSLSDELGGPQFSYDANYLAASNASAISIKLPLQEASFGVKETAAFFDGLVPEGSLRFGIAESARLNRRDYLGILNQVRNEPIGALLFSNDAIIDDLAMGYEEVSSKGLAALASQPVQTALGMTLESRISLAGAQSKVGLYHVGDAAAEGWFLPKGSAPSTHIVKACSPAYPEAVLYEALCMRAAALMDLTTVKCFLVDAGAENLLLAVERYDRCFPEGGSRMVAGLPIPQRLHQEDMCQALGISSEFKYEPTDANYLNLMASVLAQNSADAMGDRFMLGYYQLFDFVVGNCDNHLKNWSMAYSSDWGTASLAPLYDVMCTTVFPGLSREMGVSFGGSRVIDEVDAHAVYSRLASIGVSQALAKGMAEDISAEVVPALRTAVDELAAEGFPQVQGVLAKMEPGVQERLQVLAG